MVIKHENVRYLCRRKAKILTVEKFSSCVQLINDYIGGSLDQLAKDMAQRTDVLAVYILACMLLLVIMPTIA